MNYGLENSLRGRLKSYEKNHKLHFRHLFYNFRLTTNGPSYAMYIALNIVLFFVTLPIFIRISFHKYLKFKMFTMPVIKFVLKLYKTTFIIASRAQRKI